MKCYITAGITVLVLWATQASLCFARNPVGETASYVLDKAKSRTSTIIKDGKGTATIDQSLPEHPSGPSYNLSLSYELVIQLYGATQGVIKLPLPESYFTEQFMTELRHAGFFSTPDFKLKYEGIVDVVTLDGRSYRKCDQLFFYDVQVEMAEKMGVLKPLIAAAGFSPEDHDLQAEEIQDLQVRAAIYPNIPTVGAVKLDISGKVRGVSAKAGLDYKVP